MMKGYFFGVILRILLLNGISMSVFAQIPEYQSWMVNRFRIKQITYWEWNIVSEDSLLLRCLIFDTVGKLIEERESFNKDRSKYILYKYYYRTEDDSMITEKRKFNPFSLKVGTLQPPPLRKFEEYSNGLLIKAEILDENKDTLVYLYSYEVNGLLTEVHF